VANSSDGPYEDFDVVGYTGPGDMALRTPVNAQDPAADHACEPSEQIEGLVFFSCRDPHCNRVWRLDRPSGKWCLAN
jgi:hypothetical protein